MSTFQSLYSINSGTIIQEVKGGGRRKKKQKKKRAKKCKTMHFLCQK
jgi:hypothetical protein